MVLGLLGSSYHGSVKNGKLGGMFPLCLPWMKPSLGVPFCGSWAICTGTTNTGTCKVKNFITVYNKPQQIIEFCTNI